VRKQKSVLFLAPRQVAIHEEHLPPLSPGEATVKTLLSAISAGTEALIYTGQFPQDIPLDENIASLPGGFRYPLKYGYCNVGVVVEIGTEVDPAWRDRLVFSFQPHHNFFNCPITELMPVPEGIPAEDAVFLPNMETAVNLVMDARPALGEDVVVCGQGIIGLLTTALLTQFPLASLITLDYYPLRRRAAENLAGNMQTSFFASLDPSQEEFQQIIAAWQPRAADLSFELSGSPQALNLAIALTGYEGRVMIGSWYGKKQVTLDLGGRFHRSRIRLLSSQVSTLGSEWSARWNKMRRFQFAWEMLRKVHPARLITHRFPLEQAGLAYQLLDQHPEETLQVILTYDQPR
jgi:2-desacetyl-2-hydroxyethyl bacteriochlorophyllide A dehydrogenase